MSVYNDDNELEHPAFYDEKIEKKKIWEKRAKMWDCLFFGFMIFEIVVLILILICG